MKALKLTLLLAVTALGSGTSFAGDSGEALKEPKTLLRMIQAMEKSGNDRLTSRKTPGENDTYHLRAIEYLGSVERGKERFLIASAFFIRSSPAGRDTPPARGHPHIVVFRPDFSIAAFAAADVSGCYMQGNKLVSDKEEVIDFDDRDLGVRHGGYLFGALPYFFSDRITDKQWEDEEFMKREAEAEEARKRELEAKEAEQR